MGWPIFARRRLAPPFSYHDGIPEQVYNMGLLGLSNEQIANALGIELCTIYEWANTYPKLADALYESREIADGKVFAAFMNEQLERRF